MILLNVNCEGLFLITHFIIYADFRCRFDLLHDFTIIFLKECRNAGSSAGFMHLIPDSILIQNEIGSGGLRSLFCLANKLNRRL